MSLYLIMLFLVFCLINIYTIIKLSKQKRTQETKASIHCFILFALFFIAKWIFLWNIPEYVLILVIGALFVNNFFGYYLNKYNTTKNFDRVLHGYGAFSFALLFYYVVLLITPQVMSKLFRSFFVFFLGIGLGAIFELVEFAIDRKYKTKTQRNLKDTDMDMFCNVFGSFAAAVVSYFIIP